MDNHRASRLVSVLGLAFALSLLGGCLPPYDPGSTGGSQTVADSGAGNQTGADGGMPNQADSGGAPASDMAMAGTGATQDLGGVPSGDGGSGTPVVCDKVQSTASLSSPSGHHNAGRECQGCHAPGNGAPTFYLGGTLYNAVSGGAAVAGATLNVTDAAGKSLKIITADNGNFWTTTPLTYPLKVNASLCPSTLAMVSTVPSNGACNNCHNSTFRVHVP